MEHGVSDGVLLDDCYHLRHGNPNTPTRGPLSPLPESPSASRHLQLTSENDNLNKDLQQARHFFTSDNREKNKSDAEKQSDIHQFIQDKKDAHKVRFQKHKTRFEKFESYKPPTKAEKREELVAKMNYQPSAFCLDFALFSL
jgi:hypothetical protein